MASSFAALMPVTSRAEKSSHEETQFLHFATMEPSEVASGFSFVPSP